jgi:LCP family protein required for cell wall assembly
LIISVVIAIACTTATAIYAYNQLNKIKNVKISKNDADLGIILPSQPEITYSTEQKSDEICSIALFGTDVGRDKFDLPHSDSIIIATLDYKHEKIKLSSIMRDTYVKVRGYGNRKICEAYAFGGPELTVRTLNENFNLNIRDYATINFFNLEKLIDVLGGVSVEVKDYELSELNYRVKEAAELQNKKPSLLQSPGSHELNGIQAVAYCRIRKVGSGDFERTDRQRKVLSELFKKIQFAGIIKYPLLSTELFPMIETSLTRNDIIRVGTRFLRCKITCIEQQRFPVDGYCKGEFINGIWYLTLKPDRAMLANQLRKFIYEDIKPEPKLPLF